MTAPEETKDPSQTAAIARRAELSAVGAQAVDLSSTDWTPTLEDKDGNVLVPRALYIGGAGDVKVDMADGTTAIVFTAVAAGILPICVAKVYKTGTAATSIVALY